MIVQTVIEPCNPTTVEEILDVNHVPAYKMQDETDGSLFLPFNSSFETWK